MLPVMREGAGPPPYQLQHSGKVVSDPCLGQHNRADCTDKGVWVNWLESEYWRSGPTPHLPHSDIPTTPLVADERAGPEDRRARDLSLPLTNCSTVMLALKV